MNGNHLLKIVAAFLIATLAGCSGKLAHTEVLVDNAVVGAMAPLPGGGILYGEKYTGDIYKVTSTSPDPQDALAKDEVNVERAGHVDVSKGGERGLLGLATYGERTFAAWTDTADLLTVGEVGIDSVRVIWNGPGAAAMNLGGRVAMSPSNRLIVSVGDLDEPHKVNDNNALNGKILSLDPERGNDQRPNIISRGWNDPRGITYDRAGNLWVADGDRLARAGEEGPIGIVTDLGETVAASGLAFFGDKELLVCQRANKRLERYLIVDGVRAVPGRTVAKNCSYDVVEQAGGTIAYATDTSIRVS